MERSSARAWVLVALVALFAAACSGASGTSPAGATVASEQGAAGLDGLEEVARRAMDGFEVPGLAVAVVHDDAVVFLRGYGVRRLGEEAPVDGDTLFAIASNTKPFVATVVASLVAEGRLGWDDRVTDHLPDLRLHDELASRELRVTDLLSHRSGHSTWAGDLLWIGSQLDTAEVLRRLRHLEPSTSFRSSYGYSNLMFLVAGEVIRARTGQGWDAAVRSRLLEPLGMSRTTTTVDGLAELDNVATPYMSYEGELVAVPYLDVDNAGAAGGLNSSAADMSRWLRFQLAEGRIDERQLVPPEVVSDLRVPQTPIPLPPSNAELFPSRHFLAYGRGWFLYDYRGRLMATHGGGLPGMTSLTVLVPEEELGVVVLTNSESAAASALAMHVVDRFLGGSGPDWVASLLELQRAHAPADGASEEEPPGEEEPTLPLSAYAGQFDNPLLGRAVVAESEGRLSLDIVDHGGLDCPLTEPSGHVFECVWSNPVFLSSDVSFEAEGERAVQLGFRVVPDFVDPLEYVFERRADGAEAGGGDGGAR